MIYTKGKVDAKFSLNHTIEAKNTYWKLYLEFVAHKSMFIVSSIYTRNSEVDASEFHEHLCFLVDQVVSSSIEK